MKIHPMRRAVDAVGGQTKLAKLLSSEGKQVKQGHVWAWLNRDGKPPPEFVLAIEKETGVSRHDLRPDVFGPAPDAKSVAA